MGLSPSVVLVSFFVFFGGLYFIGLVCMLRLQTYIYLRSVRTLRLVVYKSHPFPSAYGPSGWRCSPEAGELRVAVRGMNFCSLERC